MRISDWGSVVCSSDLEDQERVVRHDRWCRLLVASEQESRTIVQFFPLWVTRDPISNAEREKERANRSHRRRSRAGGARSKASRAAGASAGVDATVGEAACWWGSPAGFQGGSRS